MREEFEKTHLGGNKRLTARNEQGVYVLPPIEDAWCGWQAAWNAALEAAANECRSVAGKLPKDEAAGAKTCEIAIRMLTEE